MRATRGPSHPSGPRSLARGCVVVATAVLLAVGLAAPALAVNTDHGNRVVSADPANFTPQVMNGAVLSFVQVGQKIVAAGTFTTIRQSAASGTITRNGIFAFDAVTGAIDPAFNPDLGAGGSANSLDTDGTHIYVGGAFGSVGGDTRVRRLAKLTVAGTPVPGFATPSAAVNEVVVRGSRVFIGGQFRDVDGVPRGAFAAVDAGTGDLLPNVDVPFTGTYNGGGTGITRMDVNPAGTRVVAVGNFITVAGQTREQVAIVDTPAGAAAATVSSWSTQRLSRARNTGCSVGVETWTRDVDISPDGTYFVLSTSGAFGGGAAAGVLCDTTSRWELGRTGGDQEPSWINYTGGDTTYGVAITGGVVYVGGHMRWQNNPSPSRGDVAGPGAVPREGIAALDPVNGLPLTWNPGRLRGVGAQALYATDQGLWVGSDTDRIGGELRPRLALMPLAGGSTVEAVPDPELPNDVFAVQRTAPGAILRRGLNAAGAPTSSSMVANADMDWSTVRGATMIGGTLYYGRTDGAFYRRTFDPVMGATGPEVQVDLRDDPVDGRRIPFPVASLSGLTYDASTHRLYYTVVGDARLFYRYFTPQSEVVGAETFIAPTAGIDFRSAAGLAVADGRLLYGSTADGWLRAVSFRSGALSGAPAVLSTDRTWAYRDFFVGTGEPRQSVQAPTVYLRGGGEPADTSVTAWSVGGRATDQHLLCDWDGDGRATLGLYRSSNATWYITNQAGNGSLTSHQYGSAGAGDRAFCGDWDGNGTQTFGLYRSSTNVWHLRNAATTGQADHSFGFGRAGAGDTPVIGDWDGDGTDTPGIYRSSNNTWYLTNRVGVGGNAQLAFAYGRVGVGDTALAGDWDGDGSSTPAIFRTSDRSWHLRNSNTTGVADWSFRFGTAGDVAVVGDWDADGRDEPGLSRSAR